MGFSLIELLLVGWSLFFSGSLGVPMGMVPGEEDPYLSKIAPEDCVMYASWSACDQPDATKNRTEKWMAQKEIKKYAAQFKLALEQSSDELMDESDAESRMYGAWIRVYRNMLSNPGAFYIREVELVGEYQTPEYQGALIVRMKDDAPLIQQEFDSFTDEDLKALDLVRKVENGVEVLWGNPFEADLNVKMFIKEGYFYLAFSEDDAPTDIAHIFENEQTPEPEWLSQIKERLPVARRASIGMMNAKPIIDMDTSGELGFLLEPFRKENFQTIGYVSGLNDHGFVCKTWIECEPVDDGVLSIILGESLKPDDLDGIPKGKMLSTSTRLSTEAIYQLIEESANEVGAKQEFDQQVAQFEAFAGLSLKEDLISKLDNYVYLYGGFDLNNPADPWVLGIGIKDTMGFLDTLENFNQRISEVMVDSEGEFERQQFQGYEIAAVTTQNPWNAFMQMNQVAWGYVDGQLVLSTSVAGIEQFIANKSDENAENRLIETPSFKRLMEFADANEAQGPIAFFNFDLGLVFEKYWGFLGLLSTSDLFPDVELPKAPGVVPMTNGMSANLTGVYRVDGGLMILQEQTWPSSSPVNTVAFLMVSAGLYNAGWGW